MTKLELKTAENEFVKLVKKVETVETVEEARMVVSYVLTKDGVKAIEDFCDTLSLDPYSILQTTPYGLGSGAYTNVKRRKVKKIGIVNGLPYIMVDVMSFDFEGNMGVRYYTKTYLKGVGHTFSESLESPRILRDIKRVEAFYENY